MAITSRAGLITLALHSGANDKLRGAETAPISQVNELVFLFHCSRFTPMRVFSLRGINFTALPPCLHAARSPPAVCQAAANVQMTCRDGCSWIIHSTNKKPPKQHVSSKQWHMKTKPLSTLVIVLLILLVISDVDLLKAPPEGSAGRKLNHFSKGF